MSYSQLYRTLFDLQILHQYYLNSGSDSFREMDTLQQKLMLKAYDFSGFLKVIPTNQTVRALNNHHLMFRSDNQGIRVISQIEKPLHEADPAPPFIELDDALELHFLVKINDPSFENYTDLALVKNELFFFSNIQPNEMSGYPKKDDAPDDPNNEPDEVTNLPTYEEQLLNPVYIRNDFRMDAETSQNLINLIRISKEDQIGLLGVIVLRMKGTSNDITENGLVPKKATTFVMEFANRSTIWKYYFQNSEYYAETTTPQPLTRNGYIVIKEAQLTLRNKDPELQPEDYDFDLNPYYYPAPDVRKTELEAGNFYSVIYI